MNKRGILHRMRAAGLLLALFALTFKAMLPPGYMLSSDEGRQIAVSLCGGSETILDIGGGRDHDRAPADNGAGQACPFAFTSAPVVTESGSALPLPNPILVGAAPSADAPAHHVRVAVGPALPARGPPLQV